MTTTEKLERLHNRATNYELVCKDGEKTYLAGYTRMSKRGILGMLQRNGEKWAKRISETDRITLDKNGKEATVGRFTIEFSRRTQREAIIMGELPWFEEIPSILTP